METQTKSLGEGSNLSSGLLTLGAALLLVVCLSGKLTLWSVDGVSLLPTFKRAAAAAVVLVLAGLAYSSIKKEKLQISLTALGAALAILFFSDWLCRGYNFYQGPEIRGELLTGSMLALAMLFYGGSRSFRWVYPLGLLFLLASFLIRADGHVLWTDDHSTFQYRLYLLREHFPNPLMYNPLWNAGLYAGDLLATGSLNVFILSAPFLLFDSPTEIYNLLFISIAFGVTSLSGYFAARVLGCSKTACAVSAILSVSSSLYWFTWGFKYGTMGFFTTCGLAPINVALTTKLLSRSNPASPKELLALCITFPLMVFWAPAALIFLPVFVFGLAALPRLVKQRAFLAASGFLMLVLLPWLFLLISATNIGGFLHKGVFETERHDLVKREGQVFVDRDGEQVEEANHGAFDLSESVKLLREKGMSTNPLILIFGVLGVFLLPGSYRTIFSVTAVWMLLLGTVVAPYKPQLELSRMLVILGQCLSVTTAIALVSLFRRAEQSLRQTSRPALLRAPSIAAASLAGGFLLIAPLSGSAFIWNRTLHHYYFADNEIPAFIDAVKEYGGEGRVLFSGFILHDFYHAHIAPLVLKTGKPMVARSHVHNVWWRDDVIPEEFRRGGDAGIEEFLNLKNVTLVVAHEKAWTSYFRERPDKYSEVYTSPRFKLFQRKNYEPSYFLSGEGKVLAQETDGIRLRIESQEAVLKFNYFPTVRATACDIEGQKVTDEISLIRLTNCPIGREVEIYGKTLNEWFRGR